MSQAGTFFIPGGGGGSGTVTSIGVGTGLTGTSNPITTSGTISLTIPVTIADGGTNATSMAHTDGVVYFDGTSLVTTAVGTDTYVLTSNGPGMAPTFQPSSGGSAITTIDGDSGSVTGTTITIEAGVSTLNSGSSVSFSGSGTTLTFDVSDSNNNTIVGIGAGKAAISGTYNVGLGFDALSNLANGVQNTALGPSAGSTITSGGANVAVGISAMGGSSVKTGLYNIAIGDSPLLNVTSASQNIAIGRNAGNGYTSSEIHNIILGPSAGTVSTSGEMWLGDFTNTSTTYIAGVAGVTVSGAHYVTIDPSTGQFGATSGGTADISITGDSGGTITASSFTFTGGSTGLTFAGSGTTETLGGVLVVSNGGTGASTFTSHGVLLGNTTSAITATAVGTTGQFLGGNTGSAPTWQTPSITLTGDTGGGLTSSAFTIYADTTGNNCGSSVSISGSGSTLTLNVSDTNKNTIIGNAAGNSSISGTTNTGIGGSTLFSLSSGVGNTATGFGALNAMDAGDDNTALGVGAGTVLNSVAAIENTYVGSHSGFAATTGANNTALGYLSLASLTTGSRNVIIGSGAGSAYTSSESNNIILGPSIGTAITNGEMWLGDFVAGATTYIAGVAGVGGGTDLVTIVPGTGQLGSTPIPTLATHFVTDSGTAIPSSGTVNVIGGTGITTSAVGDTVTITNTGSGAGGTPNSFNAVLTSPQTINFGTTATIVYDTITFTNGAGYNTANGIYTVPSTGTWRINAGMSGVATPATGDTITLVYNSNPYVTVLVAPVTDSGNYIDVELEMAQNDTIYIEYTSTSGAVNAIVPGTSIPYVTWFEATQLVASSVTTITLTGDVGGPLSSNSFTIDTNGVSGSSAVFVGSGSTLLLQLTDSGDNTLIGRNSGNSSASADVTGNTGFGLATLHAITTFGNHNVAVGNSAMTAATTAANSVAVGYHSLIAATTGGDNIAVGESTLNALLTGTNNIVVGFEAGQAYTSSESNNIILGPSTGTLATSGEMWLGDFTNTSTTYIAGVSGVSVANTNLVTINTATGQLGSQAAGTGGFVWHDVTGGSATVAAGNGYIADLGTLTTFTMPTNNTFGDTIKIVGKGTGGWTLIYSAGQNIVFGNITTTTTTGNLSSSNAADCIELVCTTASGTAPIFTVVNSMGNITWA